MEPVVILGKLEQEYLLRVIESAVQVRDLRQFYLWTQGQLQALLPHQLMLCMQIDHADRLLRVEGILGISALTVKNHLQRIYQTVGVSNRTHALSRCLALHLLEPLARPARRATAAGPSRLRRALAR